jgi:hypothetical protein
MGFLGVKKYWSDYLKMNCYVEIIHKYNLSFKKLPSAVILQGNTTLP